ncbi:hypothetical protein BM221_010470 [Beauveria bassiana]|uniref:C2H2-type domain-containing protein n=1 Tax=Beauveria bassiana TaxID=176275 RepID=A0A2N6N8Z2_BEABA|nr:hypothetical protein BM221_010470 [Beauveria bassiana]
MFHHRAFRAPDLISPEQLTFLKIHPGERELSLPLKPDIQDTFIFRKIIKTATGYEMSTEQLPYNVMHRMLKIIGQILGREYPTISYSLRYNTGNALDRDPHVSDSLRNLILGHKDSGVFQTHYLGREIAVDTLAIVQGLEPQQAMMIQATSLGHSASKRRPRHLTAEQREKLKSHPMIVRLEKKVQQYARGSEEYSKATKELTKVKLRLQDEEKQKMLDEWTAEQAVEDIQRQLHGVGFKPPAEDTARTPQGQEQQRFTKAFSVLPSKKIEEYFTQRNEAISAIMAYCRVYEGPPSRRRRAEPVRPVQQANDLELNNETLKDAVLKSVMVDDAVKRPRKCFVCVGNALRPDSIDSGFSSLTADFYSSSDLNKHFRRFHLQNLQESQTLECPACSGVLLEHKQEFMAHAQVVHGIHLRVGNSYEADSKKNNASIGCKNDRRSRKRAAESSILVARDDSRKSGNSADHTDRNSNNTNKRQKRLEHAITSGEMSVDRRTRYDAGYLPATAEANKRNYTASANDVDDRNGRSSKRQTFEPANRREEDSASRRTKYYAGYSPVSTEAHNCNYTASTNDADDENGRTSKRQKPTSYHTSKVASSEYEGERRSPVASGNGSFSGVPRASTFENPNRRERTAVRPRASLLLRRFSPADTKTQTDVASDGDRAKTARQYQPSVRFSDQSSDDNPNHRNRPSKTPTYADARHHGAVRREKQTAMRTPGGYRTEAAPKSILWSAREAAADHRKTPDPNQAKRGRTRVAFTDEQNMLLRQLKGQRLSWKEIHKCFTDKYPGRSQNTLQVHYSTKLSSGTK